jgi:hypothetical protein
MTSCTVTKSTKIAMSVVEDSYVQGDQIDQLAKVARILF